MTRRPNQGELLSTPLSRRAHRRNAHADVFGALDGGAADPPKRGVVVLDRKNGLIHVRPLRSRRSYTLTLSDVATMICRKVIRKELEAHWRPKRAPRPSPPLDLTPPESAR